MTYSMETSEVLHLNSIKKWLLDLLLIEVPKLTNKLEVESQHWKSILFNFEPTTTSATMVGTSQQYFTDMLQLEMKMPYSRAPRKAGTWHPEQTRSHSFCSFLNRMLVLLPLFWILKQSRVWVALFWVSESFGDCWALPGLQGAEPGGKADWYPDSENNDYPPHSTLTFFLSLYRSITNI